MQIGPRLIEPPQPTPPPAPQPTPPPVPQPTPPPAPQQPTPPPAPQQPPVSQLAEPPHQTEATPPSPPSPPTRPPLIVKNSSPQPPIQPKQPQRPQSPKKPHGCCCSHFFIFLLLIFCIVGGGLIHLVKGIKNAVVAVATPIVQLIKRPADDIQTDNASLSFQLPQSISLRFVKVKSGSYRPVPPNNGGQMPSYEITIPKDFWITEIDVTEDQWRTMMSTSLNTMGVSINEVNEFCRRLTNHFAGQLPQGYHFALPTDNEWNLAVLQHKDRLTGLARRGDVFHTRLYGFHLALVPDGK